MMPTFTLAFWVQRYAETQKMPLLQEPSNGFNQGKGVANMPLQYIPLLGDVLGLLKRRSVSVFTPHNNVPGAATAHPKAAVVFNMPCGFC